MNNKAVNSAEDELYQQLLKFSKGQIDHIKRSQLTKSTVNLVVTCCYLSGAIKILAGEGKVVKQDAHLAILQCYLIDIFGMTAVNASGLLESSQRLHQKYVYLGNAFKLGSQAAINWINGESDVRVSLEKYLHERGDVTMLDLGIEGVCEAADAAALTGGTSRLKQVIDAAARVARRSYLFWLAAAIFLTLANYFLFKFLL